MHIALILFFISLAGITLMISRRVALMRSGVTFHLSEFHPFFTDFKKMRSFVWRKMRIYGYATLVFLVKRYVNVSDFFKHLYRKIEISIRKKMNKNTVDEYGEPHEVSIFLRKISDYKQRIRIIKDKIEREKMR